VIVADTGAVIALIDAHEHHHRVLRSLFEHRPEEWVLPWAVLPEIDYLVATHLGDKAEQTFLADLASGAFTIEWGGAVDLAAAHRICKRHRSLRLGLVDGVVMAVAERIRASAIATLDVRHFAAVPLRGQPKLLPRDL
jgi:hypothetical protein